MATYSIVIADDDPYIRGLLVEVLVEEGYEVRACGDGLSALAEVRCREPALVLLDVAMPVMTGDEALRQLRAEGFHGPIVIATAAREAARLLNEGATSVVSKPFDLHALLEVVSYLIVTSAPLHALTVGDGQPGGRQSSGGSP